MIRGDPVDPVAVGEGVAPQPLVPFAADEPRACRAVGGGGDTRDELFQQVLAIWAEELPMIGYLGESPSLVIVKNGFRGYKPGFPLDDTTGDEHLLHTETYYWENPA